MAFNLDFLRNVGGTGSNIFGASAPSYLQEMQKLGLLESGALEKAQNQSLFKGLLGAGLGYLAQPKNQGYGSALPYLAKAGLQGMQAAEAPFESLGKDAMMNKQMKDYALSEQKRKDLEDIQRRLMVTTPGAQVPSNQYTPIQGVGPDGTTQISPNMNFVQQTQAGPSTQSIDPNVMQELMIKQPALANQYLSNEKLMQEAAKLKAEANAGPGLNIAKLQPSDYSKESWNAYARPGSPYYGDTTILSGNTDEVKAKIKAHNAQIADTYNNILYKQGKGAADEFARAIKEQGENNIVTQGQQVLPTEAKKADSKQAYKPGDAITLPLTNETMIPRVYDPNTPGEDVKLLKANQSKASRAYRGGVESLSQEKKRIADVLNSDGFDRIWGIAGQIYDRPGGSAANARALVNNIKNMEFLANYKDIKAAGGGMGSLSDAEGKRLEELRVALSETQDAGQARQMLMEVDQILSRQIENDLHDYMSNYGPIEYKPAVTVPKIRMPGDKGKTDTSEWTIE
jgi:hypothetical protein